MFMFAATLIAVTSFGGIAVDVFGLPPHLASLRTRRLAPIAVFVSTVMLLVVLRTMASFDVRDSVPYILLYLVVGLGWLGAARFLPLGISLRDDVFERDNLPAAIAWAGACVGLMACYAGANIGDGPSIFCVFHAAGLATLGFWLTAILVASTARLPEHVTIDRDFTAGLRLASFFVASGVLWGRGAAGDFESYGKTVVEMSSAWPVALLVAKVVVVERIAKPIAERPTGELLVHGLLPVLIDVLLVLVGLILAGPLPDGYVPPDAYAY